MFHSSLALLLAAAPTDVTVSAVMAPGDLVVGQEHSFTVDLSLGEGVSSSQAGLPAPFLQLEVPDGVSLGGRYVQTFRQLSRNEFVMEPYERLLQELPATVTFTLDRELAPGTTLGINVTGYLHRSEGEQTEVTFVRRRLELPLTAGASARPGEVTRSTWGPDEDLLQIGSKAPGLVTVRPDGSTLDLADVLGTKRVVVTTYRAHW